MMTNPPGDSPVQGIECDDSRLVHVTVETNEREQACFKRRQRAMKEAENENDLVVNEATGCDAAQLE